MKLLNISERDVPVQVLGTVKVKGRRRKGAQSLQNKDRGGKPMFRVAVAHLGNASLN